MRRSAVRLLALLGAAALGLFLCRAGPRDIVLVYDLRGVPDARALEVRISKGGELLRRVEFASPGAQARHELRLTDGVYHLRYAIERGGDPPLAGDRDIEVKESQTIVLSLSP